MKSIFFKGRFIFIPLAVIGFLAGVGFVVMELWNNLLPDILHVGTITFGQAIGLFVLCKILFGFGRGGRHGMGGAPWMRQRMQEKFKGMTPDERAAFRAKWEQRCGSYKGWNRGNRHPFEAEWDETAAEEAKPAQ